MKAKNLTDEQWQLVGTVSVSRREHVQVVQFSSSPDVSQTVFMEIPPDVRSGGRSAGKEALVDPSADSVSNAVPIEHADLSSNSSGSAERGTQQPLSDVRERESLSMITPPHSYRFVVERGSGSSGTAYNKLDHEVIDLERTAGHRIVARATCLDAELICRALNAFGR